MEPYGFLRAAERPLILDEMQRAPDLLRAASSLSTGTCRRMAPSSLTGSANILTLAKPEPQA